VGEQHAGVDDRRVAEPLEVSGKRPRPVAIQEKPEHGCRRALLVPGRAGLRKRACRAQASFLDDGADPPGGPGFEPPERRRRYPAGEEQLASTISGNGGNPREAVTDRADVRDRRPRRPAHEQQLERPVDVEREAPATPQIVDAVSADLLEPARQGVVRR
jgi:hypothetical protein